MVPDLVEGAGGALESGLVAVVGGEGGFDVGGVVGDAAGGDDAGVGEDLVGVNRSRIFYSAEKRKR